MVVTILGGQHKTRRVEVTQNRLWQAERCARHKPQTGSPRFRRYFYMDAYTQTEHTTCMKCCWQMLLFCLPYPKNKHAELICLTTGWWVEQDLNSAKCPSFTPPWYHSFRPMCGFFLPVKLINEVPSVEPVGAAEGSHALRPAGEWQEQMWHPCSVCPSYPQRPPLLIVKQSILDKKTHYFLPSKPLPITLALIKTKTELSPIS